MTDFDPPNPESSLELDFKQRQNIFVVAAMQNAANLNMTHLELIESVAKLAANWYVAGCYLDAGHKTAGLELWERLFKTAIEKAEKSAEGIPEAFIEECRTQYRKGLN